MTTVQNETHNVGEENFVDSLVILVFAQWIPQQTIEWIVNKIVATRAIGGSELEVFVVVDQYNQITKAHVFAENSKLLHAAERMDMLKMYRDGTMREFCISDLSNFKGSNILTSFLTSAEKERIVKHELDSIRALSSDCDTGNVPHLNLYPDEAIISRCLKEGIVVSLYPLHDERELIPLCVIWYNAYFRSQPIDEIKNYFGENVAFYFAYFGFWTWYLIIPACFGLLCHFGGKQSDEEYAIIASCVFNLIWLTVFLEMWKRRTAELAYRWGTTDMELFEDPRPEYYGLPGHDPISGRIQPQYPATVCLLKVYFVSGPILIFMLLLLFGTMLQFLQYESHIKSFVSDDDSQVMRLIKLQLPSTCYVVVILLFTSVYRLLAVKLTNWGM